MVRREEREHGLRESPPGRGRLASPYDLDARYPEKHGMSWTGYKDSLTETISDPADDDPGTGRPSVPNLVTDVETTHAAVPGVMLTAPARERLAARDLLPGEHDADPGYIPADLLVSSPARGVVLAGPLLAGNSAQARSGGHTAAMFTIDWDRGQATCPEGAVSSKWAPMRQHDGKEAISVRFAAATCGPCPAKDKRATAIRTGRQLFPRPREIHEAVTAARAEEGTRPAVERPLQGTRRRRGPHGPGQPRHRHPARPLHRPAQDPPGAPRLRHRDQRDPARRLVHGHAHRPHQNDPSPAT